MLDQTGKTVWRGRDTHHALPVQALEQAGHAGGRAAPVTHAQQAAVVAASLHCTKRKCWLPSRPRLRADPGGSCCTFSAASVQPAGEQLCREQPGQLIQPHGPAHLQLLWSGERQTTQTVWSCSKGQLGAAQPFTSLLGSTNIDFLFSPSRFGAERPKTNPVLGFSSVLTACVAGREERPSEGRPGTEPSHLSPNLRSTR